MKLFHSDLVKEQNYRFYIITQWAYVIGFLGHIAAYFRFRMLEVDEMLLFNLIYSIPCFALAFFINRRGRHNTAFFIAFIELLAHQVLTTYYLGWDFGAHYLLIYLAGLCFFNASWNIRVQLGMLGLVLFSYIFMYLNYQEGIYAIEMSPRNFNNLSIGILVIIIISLLINYFSKATRKAENRLKAEQVKTENMLNKVEALFGQQVSEEIAQELISQDVDLTSKQYDLSIMFLDIRDFTVFADSHEPREVAKFQNAVFSQLIEIVKAHRGVVLQILGDGIMAVFGAPKSNATHAHDAVQAGLAMLDKIKDLRTRQVIPHINVGIGVHSGKVIAGNVGNQSRKFYSLTGKNVIIAARIEQLNKQYKSQFLISESTFERLKDPPDVVDLGKIALKGIENATGILKIA